MDHSATRSESPPRRDVAQSANNDDGTAIFVGGAAGEGDVHRNPRRSVRRSSTMDMVNSRIFPTGSNPLGHCVVRPAPTLQPTKRMPRRSSMTVKTQNESIDETNAAPLRLAARQRRRRRSSCGGASRVSVGSVPSAGTDNAEDGSAGELLNVGFTSVEIHEHPVRCGDNPCCSSGPPLTISWDAEARFSYPLDTYESRRSIGRRQETREMIIPPHVRTRMLRGEGHSFGEILRCTQDADRGREEMIRTMCQSKTADAIEETVERTRRAVGNLFRKKKKDEERFKIKRFMEDSKKAEEEQRRVLEERERDCPAA